MSRKVSKHHSNIKEKKYKHNKKSLNKKALIIVLFIIVAFVFTIIKNKNKKIEPLIYENTQIIFNNKNITEELSDKIIIKDGYTYISTKDAQQFLDKTIYQEDETKTIITTSSKKIATLKIGENHITINGSTKEIEAEPFEDNNIIYIPISVMQSVYNYEINYIYETNVVIIDSLNKKQVTANAKKNILVKQDEKTSSKPIEKVKKDDELILIEEGKKAKVRTLNGNIGYVNMKDLINITTKREDWIEETKLIPEDNYKEYNITNKDISTYDKRLKIINSILQDAVKNDNMNIKIIYENEKNENYERFKIEVVPILQECGLCLYIE